METAAISKFRLLFGHMSLRLPLVLGRFAPKALLSFYRQRRSGCGKKQK